MFFVLARRNKMKTKNSIEDDHLLEGGLSYSFLLIKIIFLLN